MSTGGFLSILWSSVSMYDIIASTHSAFSKNHADSFEANEVKNLGECNISLPEWSLAGDGYTVSIQKKAI